jgi:hypothetical protein
MITHICLVGAQSSQPQWLIALSWCCLPGRGAHRGLTTCMHPISFQHTHASCEEFGAVWGPAQYAQLLRPFMCNLGQTRLYSTAQ